jgi:hypothetical protein
MPRHQIKCPKRAHKESAQGWLPHNNTTSTIEFLRSQRWSPVQPIGHMEANNHAPKFQKGSSGHAECAAEEGAKGAACGAFIFLS